MTSLREEVTSETSRRWSRVGGWGSLRRAGVRGSVPEGNRTRGASRPGSPGSSGEQRRGAAAGGRGAGGIEGAGGAFPRPGRPVPARLGRSPPEQRAAGRAARIRSAPHAASSSRVGPLTRVSYGDPPGRLSFPFPRLPLRPVHRALTPPYPPCTGHLRCHSWWRSVPVADRASRRAAGTGRGWEAGP